MKKDYPVYSVLALSEAEGPSVVKIRFLQRLRPMHRNLNPAI